MPIRFSRTTLSTAVLVAFGSINAASADPIHYVDWKGFSIPDIQNEYSISGEEADKHANQGSWFSVLHATDNATGAFNDFDMTVKTVGSDSKKQFMAVDVEDGKVEFGGSSFNLSVETDFLGTGNNQATGVLVEDGSSAIFSADQNDISVISTNTDGKSVYGMAVQDQDSLIQVSSKETTIHLKTNTNRDNSNPKDKISTYSEAPALNAAAGGVIHFTEGTKLNIFVESTGNALYGQWTDSNTDSSHKDWIGNYWGGSPAYGIKLEGGRGIFEGEVNIDVKSNGGRAVGVATTNYFATSEWDQVWGNAAGSFQDLTIKANSTAGQAIGIDVGYTDGDDNDVILVVNGDTQVTSITETGTARGILVSGKTAANFEGNVNVAVTATDSADIRGIVSQSGAELNIGQNGNTETVSIDLSNGSQNTDSIAIGMRAHLSGSVLNVKTDNLVITGKTNGWIYGINAQNSTTDDTENLAKVVVDADKTIIDVSSTGQDSAAIVAMSQGQVEINGDLYVNADAAIITRGKASTVINKDGTATTQLNGDIRFDYDVNTSKTPVDADVLVNLSGENSYWNGNTLVAWNGSPKESELEVNGMRLGLSEGAQWNPTLIEDSDNQSYIALNNLSIDDGVINIQHGAQQTVKVEKLSGVGGTVNLTATTQDGETIESGTLNIDQTEGQIALSVNAVGITADDISNPESALKSLNEKVVADSISRTNTISEGDIMGEMTQDVSADGQAGTIHIAENTKLASMKGVNAAALVAWRDEVAYTNQRLEFLRDASHAYGAWAQVYGGESSYDDASVDLKSTTVQVGADASIGDWVVGGAFSYMKGDADMTNGSADTDAYTLALYTARQFDSGFYVNGMARYGRLSTDATAGNMTGSYDNNAFSVGGNVGYRFTFAQQAFVEPQFGLQYAYVTGDDYTATNGVKVEQDNFDALVASLGARVGFNFAQDAGKLFARASVNHDFLGEVDGTAANDKAMQSMYVDLGGTWVTYGVGAQFNFTDNLSVWGNVDRSTGGEVSTHYMMNAGLRYTF